MYRSRLMISGLLFLIVTVLIGCGDVEIQNKPLPPETEEIRIVLKDKWKQGYETEDLELYMSSFWEEGYFYWSDMATDDIGDDVSFDEWEEERDSAIRVFTKYRNIEIEISDPPEVEILDSAKTKAEVRNHYKIQLFVPEGTSLPGGYEAYFAEGDNIFTFDFRENGNGEQEWRITEWRQNEYSEEEIQATWDLQ
ncbi:hypothetical protein ACFL6S_36955 [Candidatus Poribacteria bacterium]